MENKCIFVPIFETIMATIDQEIGGKFENGKIRMMANLMFTANQIRHIVNTKLKPFGISEQQFNILRILRGDRNWLSMNTIKDRMVDRSPNATRLSDKLLDKGLIDRERSAEDRRVVYLRISEKGLALLKEIDAADFDEVTSRLNNLTEAEAKTMSDLLDKMRG